MPPNARGAKRRRGKIHAFAITGISGKTLAMLIFATVGHRVPVI
jgi:uncharacterized protein involved in response to NO